MKFQFYIKHNERINGPFSANEIYEKNLPNDTLIKEVHQKEWRNLKDYVNFKMLVRFETLNKFKSEEALKIWLKSSLNKIPFGTVDVQYSVSELLSEDEESTIENLIADNRIICHYQLEDVIGQKINDYIASPKFCQLPSGFVVGVTDGDDVFPRFLDEVSISNEKICFIICNAENKDILIYLINPTPSSLYALGCNNDEIQSITNYYFIGKVSCSYEYDITQVVKRMCFGYDVDVPYPYNTMRPFGRTNMHNWGDTYGTDSLRYNLFKAFLPQKDKEEKNEHLNLILAVSLMKDQQWQVTYEYAKQIICELKRLFVFTSNNDITFAKPIDSEYWGKEGVILVHLLYNKLYDIKIEYNSIVLNNLTNSFYFWEKLINETIKENYVCKEYSRAEVNIQKPHKIVFYLPASFTDFSMKDLGMFMVQQLSVPSSEVENLICDWEQFSDDKSVNLSFSDKPDPIFSNEREKLKYYLLEGKKIYIRCDNSNVATEAPIDCNFITIPRGKFSVSNVYNIFPHKIALNN